MKNDPFILVSVEIPVERQEFKYHQTSKSDEEQKESERERVREVKGVRMNGVCENGVCVCVAHGEQ
jgi:hypothetical protein